MISSTIPTLGGHGTEPFHGFVFDLGLTGTGATSAAAPKDTLQKNALVSVYDVKLQAAGNVFAAAPQVGQVRKSVLAGTAGLSIVSVVIDFGTLVTVDQVAVPDIYVDKNNKIVDIPYLCYRVTPWAGTQFNTWQAVFKAGYDADANGLPTNTTSYKPPGNSDDVTSIFQTEVRTERLQIELVADTANVSAQLTDEVLLNSVLAHFPGAPADLELRLNGGAPLWTLRGPIKPNTTDSDNNPLWEQTVPVADAINALVGKADDTGAIDLNFTLTAKQPGLLRFATADRARDIKYLQNVSSIGADGALDLKYDSEGTGPGFALQLPSNAKTLDEVRFTLAGNLPLERVLPPTGPGEEADVAKLVLDGAHAAAALIPATPATPLAELTGIRMPLHAEAGGAEVRVQLWSAVAGEPGAPVDGGTSKPLTLDGQKDSDGYSWVSLAFPKPVPIDASNPPYVALLVSRGRVWWSFAKLPDPDPAAVEGSAADVDAPTGKVTLRVGAPTGPWRDLPSLFAAGGDVFQLLGGNLRVIGHAPHGAPLAPLAITLSSSKASTNVPVTVTPTVKGAPVVVTSALDVTSDRHVLMNILSYIGGTITLKNLQVVLHTLNDGPPSALTTKG